MNKQISEDRVESWQNIPLDQLEDVACNKGDRKLRAKRKLEDSDPAVVYKPKEERIEKKNVKLAAKRRQETLMLTVSSAYGVSLALPSFNKKSVHNFSLIRYI